jgi:HK97 family phage major capsid protein
MSVSIKELRLKRSDKKAQMAALCEKDSDDAEMGADDVASFNNLKEECDRLEARIARLTASINDDADEADPVDDDMDDAEKRWSGRAKTFNIVTETKNRTPERFKGERPGRWIVAQYHAQKFGLRAAKDMADKTWGDDMVTKAVMTTVQPIIPQDFNTDWVHLLQAKAVTRAAGATVYSMQNGNMSIPRQNLGSTGSYFSEAAEITVSNPGFDNIQLTFHKFGALSYTSRELLEFSPLDASGIIANDLTSRLALLEDRTFINGTGASGTPVGLIASVATGNKIANTTAAGVVTFQTASFDLQNAELQMTANMVDDEGDFVWLMHPSVVSFLKQLSSSFGVFPFAAELNDGKLNGHRVMTTPQLATNLGASSANLTNIVLVKPSHMIIGDAYRWAISMTTDGSFIDGSTQINTFGQDLVAFKATNANDFALKHNVSAAVLQASAWSLGYTAAGQDSYVGQAADTAGSSASSAND